MVIHNSGIYLEDAFKLSDKNGNDPNRIQWIIWFIKVVWSNGVWKKND